MRRLITAAHIEVIPHNGAEARIGAAPRTSTLTFTCSPMFGLERTLEHAARATAAGYEVIPHLAARQVKDECALRRFIGRLDELNIRTLYVIGGDGTGIGDFHEAGEILELLRSFDHRITRIGVGCYPEGHPKIDDETLLESLLRKQRYADYMVSQLCFDSTAMLRWLRLVREVGINLPLRVGVAVPMNTRKLAQLSLKIGVGASLRFLTKQHGLVGNLIKGTAYRPEDLIAELLESSADIELGMEGIHLFSFNQIDATVEWQRRFCALTTNGHDVLARRGDQ
jgi:methylenetetrahydrofolate reductase (NADPH)